MDLTDRLALPLIAPSQAQKHVTHNEAIALIDGLLHLTVETAGLSAPPASAAAPSAHIVGPEPTGAWTGRGGDIAIMTSGGWLFAQPRTGMMAYRADVERFSVYAPSGAWEDVLDHAGISSLDRLGVGAEADATNRLVVKSSAALMTALEVGSGGNGDFRLAVNRELSGDVAAMVFQTGYSGRAELGLVGGSDAFEIRTSPDGAAWQTALKATPAGEVEVASLRTPAGSAYWHSSNDGAASGLDADLLDGNEGSFYRDAANINAGTLGTARLPAMAKAEATALAAATVDWDTLTSAGWYASLILGSNPNGPGGGNYHHVLAIRYASGAVTQLAFPYSGTIATLAAGSAVFFRGYYGGNWSGWQRLSTEARNDTRYVLATAYTAADVFAKVLTLDGSGSGLVADKVQAYATGSLPSAASRGAGAIVLVTGVSPAMLAYSDGASWRRVTDAAVIS